MRLPFIATATGCLVLASALLPAPAAASGITIDYPQPGATAVSETISADPLIEAVTLSGTFSFSADDPGTIVAYIDGRLDGCDDYFGDDIAEATCHYVGTMHGSQWTFQFTRDQFERLGFSYEGTHTIELRLLGGDESVRESDSVTFTVATASAVATPPPSIAPIAAPPSTTDAPPSGGNTASELSGGSSTAPSVLSATPTAQDSSLSASHLAVTALATIILLLIVGYPGLLLGNTLGDKDNYERLFGRGTRWLARVKARTTARNDLVKRARLPRWARVAFGMLIATVIAGFVDPGFGFNPGSARVLASVAIAFVVQNLLGWWVIRRVLKRSDPELKPSVEFKAGSLVILVIAVLVSRVVGFEPGMVFGLMVGLSFGASLATAKQARVTMIGLGYAFALAMIGWVGYSLLTAAHASGFWPVFLSETLSGLAVSGIASLPIALLPLAVFDGAALFAWRKWVWAMFYGIGLFAFLLILMPLPFSWGAVSTPLATWILLYLAYAILAVGVWAWFRFTRAHARAVPAKDVVPS